ncbi:hypothetical protein FJZ18_03445 [Candidatus Pacearchaeota archaeon]|nr:hypothetical protein [Candidatus Pacearchaeota archaeon]
MQLCSKLQLVGLAFVQAISLNAADSKKSPLSANVAITLGDVYWTRPGFFPTDKEGPVVQPEFSIFYNAGKLGRFSAYTWLNQNLDSGLNKEGMHELDLGVSYSSPPIIKTDTMKAGLSLHGAWWEYGIAGKLGKSHAIIEPSLWLQQKLSEKTSLEAKASIVQLLGQQGSDGSMLVASATLPYQRTEKLSLAPTVSWTYLSGKNFYNSDEGTAHVRAILPFTYAFSKSMSATLGVRAQAGFNGKDNKFGGFIRLEKKF